MNNTRLFNDSVPQRVKQLNLSAKCFNR